MFVGEKNTNMNKRKPYRLPVNFFYYQANFSVLLISGQAAMMDDNNKRLVLIAASFNWIVHTRTA